MPTTSDDAIPNKGVAFPESALGHKLLDGMEGIEIGPGAHNPFGLNTKSVGLSREIDPRDYDFFAKMQLEECGRVAPIDLPGDAAEIPIADQSTDFVVHSHVWEHLPNPLAALEEWARVVKPGGFIFAIVPKRDADPPDRDRPMTSLAELVHHYERKTVYEDRIAEMNGPERAHYTVFSPTLLREIGAWFNRSHFRTRLKEIAFQETDDKVGNGHTIVWQVVKFAGPAGFVRACLGKLTRE